VLKASGWLFDREQRTAATGNSTTGEGCCCSSAQQPWASVVTRPSAPHQCLHIGLEIRLGEHPRLKATPAGTRPGPAQGLWHRQGGRQAFDQWQWAGGPRPPIRQPTGPSPPPGQHKPGPSPLVWRQPRIHSSPGAPEARAKANKGQADPRCNRVMQAGLEATSRSTAAAQHRCEQAIPNPDHSLDLSAAGPALSRV